MGSEFLVQSPQATTDTGGTGNRPKRGNRAILEDFLKEGGVCDRPRRGWGQDMG